MTTISSSAAPKVPGVPHRARRLAPVVPGEQMDPKEVSAMSLERAGSVAQPSTKSSRNRSLRRASSAFVTWIIPFIAIPVLCVILFLVAFGLDLATQADDGTEKVSLAGLSHAFFHASRAKIDATLSTLIEGVLITVSVLLTVSIIVVQVAASRFTPHISALFFKDGKLISTLIYNVTTAVFITWIYFGNSEDHHARIGCFMAVILFTISLLLMFPYFSHLFDFLNPEKIINDSTMRGLHDALPNATHRGREKQKKYSAVQSIESLADMCLNALQQKDKNIASRSVDALCKFHASYNLAKHDHDEAWFRVPDWMRQSPDFICLTKDGVDSMERKRTFFEWKILRQYQTLFEESLTLMKDLCYLIAINTRKIGESSLRHGDLFTTDLTIKFFNTYLRTTINGRQIRTIYNALYQYRLLSEYMLRHAHEFDVDIGEVEDRALQIAKFFRYYSIVCLERKMNFITEIAAHDVGTLCEIAHTYRRKCHDEILSVFLTVDDNADSKGEEVTLRGIRRAQIKLATTYLLSGAEGMAREVLHDMRDEPEDRIISIRDELLSLDKLEFWEVIDRGVNIDYLSPEQKSKLPEFFSWFRFQSVHMKDQNATASDRSEEYYSDTQMSENENDNASEDDSHVHSRIHSRERREARDQSKLISKRDSII